MARCSVFRCQASARARWLALVSALGLSGCGFHLRGEVDIPPDLNPLFIQAPAGSPVAQAMVDQLRGTQVRLAASAKEAKLVLRIHSERRSSRVVAVDRSGKVLSYELHLQVTFDARGRTARSVCPARRSIWCAASTTRTPRSWVSSWRAS